MIFFREPPGLRVVFGERGVFVAQIHLRDLLDMLVEVGEALLELWLLCPDAAVDEAFFEIGQVHDTGEVLAEADWIEDGERQAARRRAGEQAQHEVVQRINDLLLPGLLPSAAQEAEAPKAAAAEESEPAEPEEEQRAPEERVSADNNLSFPVDI